MHTCLCITPNLKQVPGIGACCVFAQSNQKNCVVIVSQPEKGWASVGNSSVDAAHACACRYCFPARPLFASIDATCTYVYVRHARSHVCDLIQRVCMSLCFCLKGAIWHYKAS